MMGIYLAPLIFAVALALAYACAREARARRVRLDKWKPRMKALAGNQIQIYLQRAGEPHQVIDVVSADDQDALAMAVSRAEDQAVVRNSYQKALLRIV